MSKVIRNGLPIDVTDAKGITGFLLRSIDGKYVFRVYGPNHSKGDHDDFVDYGLLHFDLEVTIVGEASLYKGDHQQVLDHSPRTLGLKEVTILCVEDDCPNAGRHERHVE
jgi:hypothetical protein